MPVGFSFDDKDTLTAFVSGEIDHHSAAQMRMLIDGELSRIMPKTLCFDLSGVTFMDSSGIGLILGRARVCALWDGKVCAANAPDHIEKLLKLSGLAPLLAGKAVYRSADPQKKEK